MTTPPVSAKTIEPSDLWRDKDELVKRERRCRNFWAGIEDDQRAGLILAAQDALLKLFENPDKWLPGSIDPGKNNRVDLCITLELPAVDERSMQERVSEERLLNHTVNQLLEMERRLRD